MSYRYVIVDDEHLIRKGILKKIENLGIELKFVGEAENGEDALELIKEASPHIVLTDMRMPLMDGRTLLKKLQQDFPHIKIIVISGYSDFEYLHESIAANAVDYILKPFNRDNINKAFMKAIELIEKEVSAQKKLEDLEIEKERANYASDINYISSLIMSPQPVFDINHLKSKLSELFSTCTSYVLVSIYTPETVNHEACIKALRTLDFSDNILIIPELQKSNMCFLLYIFTKELKADIFSQIGRNNRRIVDLFKVSASIDTYISSSNVKTSIDTINEAYKETISALNNRDIKLSKIVYFQNSYIVPAVNVNFDNLDNFLFFIEAGNVSKADELLTDYFYKLEEMSPLTIANIKHNCQLIYSNILNTLKDYHEIFINYSFLSTHEAVINTTFDFQKIKDHYKGLIKDLTTVFMKKNIHPSEDIINNIKVYITKNYNKELTLEKLSSLFFINPSYCSFLFKEKTGENFIDYLNKIRVEKAKEFLKATDYKVYKIAKLLGYDNDKYFFRVFKKTTGFTPEEYRRL